MFEMGLEKGKVVYACKKCSPELKKIYQLEGLKNSIK